LYPGFFEVENRWIRYGRETYPSCSVARLRVEVRLLVDPRVNRCVVRAIQDVVMTTGDHKRAELAPAVAVAAAAAVAFLASSLRLAVLQICGPVCG